MYYYIKLNLIKTLSTNKLSVKSLKTSRSSEKAKASQPPFRNSSQLCLI